MLTKTLMYTVRRNDESNNRASVTYYPYDNRVTATTIGRLTTTIGEFEEVRTRLLHDLESNPHTGKQDEAAVLLELLGDVRSRLAVFIDNGPEGLEVGR